MNNLEKMIGIYLWALIPFVSALIKKWFISMEFVIACHLLGLVFLWFMIDNNDAKEVVRD